MFVNGLLAFPLIAIAAYGLVRFFAVPSKQETSDVPKHRTNMALEVVAIAVFIYFFSQIAGYLVADRAARLVSRTPEWLQNSVTGQFFLILTVEVLTLGLLFWFLRRRGQKLADIGLKDKPSITDIGYILIGYLVYFVAYLMLVSLIKVLVPALNVNQAQQIGFEQAQGGQLALVFVSLVILPPVTEEILMRGFLYSGLKRSLPQHSATVITSMLFAAAHLQAGSGAPLLWVAAIDTFVLSLILIQLRERTGGKLWAPMGLHALKNGIAFIGLFVLHVAK